MREEITEMRTSWQTRASLLDMGRLTRSRMRLSQVCGKGGREGARGDEMRGECTGSEDRNRRKNSDREV